MRIKIVTKRQEREDRLCRIEARIRTVVDQQDDHQYRHSGQVASLVMLRGLAKRVGALEAPLPRPDQEAAQLMKNYTETDQTWEELETTIAEALRRRSER